MNKLLNGLALLKQAVTQLLRNQYYARMLVIWTLVIFFVETFVMLLFEYIFPIPHPLFLVLDGAVLVGCLLPLNFIYVVRPLYNEIVARQKANQELIKTNEILSRFFAITDVLIAYMDADFNFLRVNLAYARADGHDPEYYVGKNHFKLFPNEENQRIFENVVQTGKAFHVDDKPFEYASNMERGVSYWDWSLLPILEPHGKVSGLILVLIDVTTRKRAQIALANSERRFRGVFNQTFQHSGLLDPDGNVLVVNQSALDFTGVSQEELHGKPLWQVGWWEDSPSNSEQIQAAVRQAAHGKLVRSEKRVRPRGGEPAIMDITLKALQDENGQPEMLIYEARDITTHIRAEEQIKRLYQAEKLARHLAESLRSAGLDLAGSLDSVTVLGKLLDHLHNVTSYESAHILRFEDEDHLAVAIERGEQHWEPARRLLGQSYDISDLPELRPLLKERQILSIPDATSQTLPFFLDGNPCVGSWLGLPLLAGEQVIGLCSLEHSQPSFFTADLLNWASMLTGQAAIAIQNAWLFEQVRDNRERLQALSRRLVEVQEMERNYIARELHDEAGQGLASLMVGLRLVERDRDNPEAVVTRCAELKQIADGVLENLHRLAVDLRPATLDHLGLVPALRQQAERISYQHSLAIQFETVGKIERLPTEIETAVYRIVQEALTNVVRHAHASRIDILFERRPDSLFLIVEDNGIGFDPRIPRPGQLGLVGMRERADMLGGKLTIESSIGHGTTVLMEIPCQSES